ncbi:MAG: hypothetical protein Q7W30_01450 [Coriobacteriia bacterium]|nr:hypothetical protein [Coriobacteriia bacterium]
MDKPLVGFDLTGIDENQVFGVVVTVSKGTTHSMPRVSMERARLARSMGLDRVDGVSVLFLDSGRALLRHEQAAWSNSHPT